MLTKRVLFLRATALAATPIVAACASLGAPFDERRLADLRPGTTTGEEAAAILGGTPKQVVYTPDGGSVRIWQHITAGYISNENKMAAIAFDASGRMTRVQTLINIPVTDAERRRLNVMSVADSRIRTFP